MVIKSIPPPRPRPTYQMILSEDEMLALRAAAGQSSAVHSLVVANSPDCETSDGKPALLGSTLQAFWYATNAFLPRIQTRVNEDREDVLWPSSEIRR